MSFVRWKRNLNGPGNGLWLVIVGWSWKLQYSQLISGGRRPSARFVVLSMMRRLNSDVRVYIMDLYD